MRSGTYGYRLGAYVVAGWVRMVAGALSPTTLAALSFRCVAAEAQAHGSSGPLTFVLIHTCCLLPYSLLACLLTNPSPRKYWLTEAQAKQVEALGLRRRLVEAHATAYGAAAPSTVEEVLALSLRLRQHGAWAEAMVRALLRDAVALPPVRVCPCVCRLHAAQWVQVAAPYPMGSGCNPILPVCIGADAGAARGVPLLARRGARADAPHRARARGGCKVVVAVVVQGVVAIE